jgi:hypothetical protein
LIRTWQSPVSLPCVLLGQLAANAELNGQGNGIGLLKHALQRRVQGATLIGGRALIVNAVAASATCVFAIRFCPYSSG